MCSFVGSGIEVLELVRIPRTVGELGEMGKSNCTMPKPSASKRIIFPVNFQEFFSRKEVGMIRPLDDI